MPAQARRMLFAVCPRVYGGTLRRSWRPLCEPKSPRLALSELGAYRWDSLYRRMRPVEGNR